jgi:microcystin-dependent protein
MKKLVVLLVTFAMANSLYAQVGFNNPSPDAKSLLDLTATDKGLLIPRMTTALRDGIVSATGSTPESLLVYDTDLKGFFFFNAGTWYSLNEWVRTAGSNNVSLTGNATVSGNISSGSISNAGTISTASLVSTGSLSASTVIVPGFANNALVPTGAIIMWSGSISSIPAGWALCDGSPGRPDLRDRFIVGAGSSYGVGATGGQDQVTLSISQMPSHSHSINDPGHVHNLPFSNPGGNGNGGRVGVVGSPGAYNTSSQVTGITINNNGGNQPFENRPLYYSLAYIIKL